MGLEELGLEVIETRKSEDKIVSTVERFDRVSKGVTKAVIEEGLIPKIAQEKRFNFEEVKLRVGEEAKRIKKRVENYTEYEALLKGIQSSICDRNAQMRSMLIGAPNMFCTKEFVWECIKMMWEMGKKCVPNVSLSEIALMKHKMDAEISNGYSVGSASGFLYGAYTREVKINREDRTVTMEVNDLAELYSWDDYVRSDVLFCFFTGTENKEIESLTLKTMLDIRGNKGLPTICFLSTSLDVYNNGRLKELVWNEILDKRESNSEYYGKYTTVRHTSTYFI
jgi:hypothetical protein